jgi:hypothetical protein
VTTKAVTVRLDPDDYQRLEVLAHRIGVLPGTLARMLLRESLSGSVEPAKSESLSTILRRAEALRRRLPQQSPSDVVALIKAGRTDIDQRTPV